MPQDYFIVALQWPAAAAEEAAADLAARFGETPVIVAKPEAAAAWIELYFKDEVRARLARAVLAGEQGGERAVLRFCGERDWLSFWKRHFHPLRIGRLRVCPPWDVPAAARAPGNVCLVLDPGLSFGTGGHFTTRFCLEALERLSRQRPGASLLDAGAGSGILALAGALLGFAPVTGFDHDPQCVAQAQENARRNGLETRVRFRSGDVLGPEAPAPHDIVCANLYDELLVRVAAPLAAAARWRLVLSGIRESEADRVADAFLGRGLREIRRDGDGEWCGLELEPGAGA